MSQTTETLLLIRPAAFGLNPDAEDNVFTGPGNFPEHVLMLARQEFEGAVTALRTAGITLEVIDDLVGGVSPDAVFPNNWFSSHANGQLLLYPMRSPQRRQEVRLDIMHYLQATYGFHQILDWTEAAQQELYLEGTGSLVLDRKYQIAYAALSERTHPELLERFAARMQYRLLTFQTRDPWQGLPIYHTNVMMSVGSHFALLCPDILIHDSERQLLLASLSQSGKILIPISPEQMAAFAANILEVKTRQGEAVILMSQQAYRCYTKVQLQMLAEFGHLLPIPLPTIEAIGGGSMRCMVAEIFRPD